MARIVVFSFAILALFALAGCGSNEVKVAGVLKMDGQPVEGATVSFTSEDGKQSFSGQTDAGGNFELSGAQRPGALPGTYKVVVTKRKQVAGLDAMTPDSTEYKKMMEKMGKETAKIKPPSAGPPGPGSSETKSDLPAVYASVSTTPLTAKVPPDSQPVSIDIKSKP